MIGLELMQAKADVAKLQAEAKLKDEAFQAKDESFKSKESLWQAIIESKDQQFVQVVSAASGERC